MPNDHSLAYQSPSRRHGCLLAMLILLVLAIGVAGFFGWKAWRAGERALVMAERFQKAFNFTPEISVNTRVVVSATQPILELSTVEKQIVVQHKWTHTWLQSTKVIEVEATFTARAGFDLRQPIRIGLDTRHNAVNLQLPPVKILSLGMSDVRILRDEDGLWNKLSAEDREDALRELERKAQLEIRQTDILHEAKEEGERRFREFLDSAARQSVPVRSEPTTAPKLQ